MASRAPTRTTQTAVGKGRVIKPSDIYELKVKTQQMNLRIRQLKTQINRFNDRMATNANATPSKHTNSIPQFKRSAVAAENALNSLRQQIEDARQDDKVFVVKELEEEVKLAYCENQRLNMLLQDCRTEVRESEQRLRDASLFASHQNLQRLQREVRELQKFNATLRDKEVAYSIGKQKIDIERKIRENREKGISTQDAVDAAVHSREEATQTMEDQAETLEREKEEFHEAMSELQRIINEQRQKITACLSGNVIFEEEEETKEDFEDE